MKQTGIVLYNSRMKPIPTILFFLLAILGCSEGSKIPKENNMNVFTNRLVQEKSPYLLQHAHNPVDWYPWGEEAFEKARADDKPIFLSIGYATCHWCHVMEHESFENEEIAALMNEAFVCIKVDREERPDIDNIYMTVCQMMTGSGGWPMTIVMTPEKKPFFAATYIPPEGRFGRIGMKQLIPRLSDAWGNRRDEGMSIAIRNAMCWVPASFRNASGSPSALCTITASWPTAQRRPSLHAVTAFSMLRVGTWAWRHSEPPSVDRSTCPRSPTATIRPPSSTTSRRSDLSASGIDSDQSMGPKRSSFSAA